MNCEELRKLLPPVRDFPKAGVVFRDVMPLFANPAAVAFAAERLCAAVPREATAILAPELRGTLLGAFVAQRLQLPLLVARKPGKLPPPVLRAEYATEYSVDALEANAALLHAHAAVFVVDDVLATGGTVVALLQLLAAANARCVGVGCLTRVPGLPTPAPLQQLPLSFVLEL